MNIVDKKGRGPLHHAAKSAKIPMMEFIVGTGAGSLTLHFKLYYLVLRKWTYEPINQ